MRYNNEMILDLCNYSFYKFIDALNSYRFNDNNEQEFSYYYNIITKVLHKDFSIKAGSLLKGLVLDAIDYWNDINPKTKIDIPTLELIKLIYQYERINLSIVYGDGNLNYLDDESLYQVSNFVFHPVTKFIVYIILFYLFNERYRNVISKLKASYANLCDDRIIIVVLYNLLTDYYKVLDFSPELRYTDSCLLLDSVE